MRARMHDSMKGDAIVIGTEGRKVVWLRNRSMERRGSLQNGEITRYRLRDEIVKKEKGKKRKKKKKKR